MPIFWPPARHHHGPSDNGGRYILRLDLHFFVFLRRSEDCQAQGRERTWKYQMSHLESFAAYLSVRFLRIPEDPVHSIATCGCYTHSRRIHLSIHKTALLTGLLSCSLVPATQAEEHDWDRNQIRHVLLISIDGMHAVDYLNCKNGSAE